MSTYYLVKLVNELCSHTDKPKTKCSVVITDFSKYFDLINHNILINDLLNLGTRPSVIPWVCSFLEQLKMIGIPERILNFISYFHYQNHVSEFITLKGGPPQGTKFGPIGFLAKFNEAIHTYSTEGRVQSLEDRDTRYLLLLVEKRSPVLLVTFDSN